MALSFFGSSKATFDRCTGAFLGILPPALSLVCFLCVIIELIPEIITSKEVIVTDKNINNYFFENSKINLKINEIIGKEVFVEFEDSFFGNKNNDPILKGKSVISNSLNRQSKFVKKFSVSLV